VNPHLSRSSDNLSTINHEREIDVSYLLLIIEPPDQRSERSNEERHQAYDRMFQFAGALKERGVLLAADSLASGGVRMQKREGRTTLIDGPFAEAKEMVGGYFLLDCATREEAIAIAAECPALEWCTVEIRKVGPCWE
jgi:hypothetical protein